MDQLTPPPDVPPEGDAPPAAIAEGADAPASEAEQGRDPSVEIPVDFEGEAPAAGAPVNGEGSEPPADDAGIEGAAPAETAPEPDSGELEQAYLQQESWQDLIGLWLSRSERATEPAERVVLLRRVAETFETRLGDADSAYVTLEAALGEDPANEAIIAELGRMAEPLGRWDDLVATCTRALEQVPGCQTALSVVEESLRRQERWAELAAALARHADLASGNRALTGALLLELATISEERLGDPEQAVGAYEEVLAADPANAAALGALERLYEQTGKTEAYIGILERKVEAIDSDQAWVDLHKKMATLWEGRLGKPLRACEALEKILLIDAKNERAYRELDRLYRQEEQWQPLADLCRKQAASTKDKKERKEITFRLAQLLEQRLGDPDHAAESYREVLAVEPQHPEALAGLGRLSEAAGNVDEAFEVMQKRLATLTNTKEKAELNDRMGKLAYEQLRDPSEAEGRWTQALALDPTRADTMRALISLYRERDDWKKGSDLMVRLAELGKDRVEKIALLLEAAAICNDRLSDADRAYEIYAQVLDIDPMNTAAAEPLAEISFALEEWGAVLRFSEMLLRPLPKSDTTTRRRTEAELAQIHLRMAKAAQRLADTARSSANFRRAAELDPELLPELAGWAAAVFDRKEWKEAARLYEVLYNHPGAAESTEQVVEFAYRLGRARLELGERKSALEMLESAHQLDSGFRPALEDLARVRIEFGDFRGALEGKKQLLATSLDVDEKCAIACQIAEICRDKLKDRDQAMASYRQALEWKPNDQHLMHEVLEMHTAGKQWKEGLAILMRLADLEKGARKAKYLVAAGNILNYEMKSSDEAVDLYNEALDEDPDDFKTFERIDKIMTEKKDWKNEERNFRRMLKRIGQDTTPSKKAAQVALWRGLGEIYRSRLGDLAAATAAFEVCAQLDASDGTIGQALDEVYQRSGPAGVNKAVDLHRGLFQQTRDAAEMATQIRALNRLTAAASPDRAWCFTAALVALDQATPEEQGFHHQYRPPGLPKLREPLSEEQWQKHVYHPEEDRRISAIFATVSRAVAIVRARDAKALGLPRSRHDFATDHTVCGRILTSVSAGLGIPCPETYLMPSDPGDIDMVTVRDKTTVTPSFLVKSGMLGARSEKELAFVAAKKLSLMRPDHFVMWPNVVPTADERSAILIAAGRLVQPALAADPDLVDAVNTYADLFKRAVPPDALEQLAMAVPRLFGETANPDLGRWSKAVDLSTSRAALLVCNDLDVARRIVTSDPPSPDQPSATDRVMDLVRWSVSDEYFALRDRLYVTA